MYDPDLPRLLRRLCRERFGEEPTRLTHQEFGHNSSVWDAASADRSLILRVHPQPETFSETEANLETLRGLGLPVPRVMASDLSRLRWPWAWMALEKLPGSDLRYTLAGMTPTQMTALAERIVGYQRVVMALPEGPGYGWASFGRHGGFSTWRDVVERDLASGLSALRNLGADPLAAHLEDAAARFLPECEAVPPTCFLDDLTVKNVLIQDGVLSGLVDFDNVCYGDPLYWIALTRTGILADLIPTGTFAAAGPRVLIYLDELARLWQASPRDIAKIRFYALVHAANFVEFPAEDAGFPSYMLGVIAEELISLDQELNSLTDHSGP